MTPKHILAFGIATLLFGVAIGFFFGYALGEMRSTTAPAVTVE